MYIKLVAEFVYEKGGEPLMLKVMKEHGGVPKYEFALDEVYTVVSLGEAKKYIPDFTIDNYKAWLKSKHDNWKDAQINQEMFA
jgi:hypothetical protein